MTFSVVATGSSFSLIYSWRFDGANLENGADYSGVTTDTLTVLSVNEDDEGFYSCFVLIDFSVSQTSDPAQLALCKLLITVCNNFPCSTLFNLLTNYLG